MEAMEWANGEALVPLSDGDSLNYQYWYRELATGGVCGNSHNLTNGVNIVWGA